MVNVLNHFKQPDENGDNEFVMDGTVSGSGTFNYSGGVGFSGDVEFSGYAEFNDDITFGTEIYSINKINNVLQSAKVYQITADGELPITGIAMCEKADGLALILPAPQDGCLLELRFATLTSGAIVVTCDAGVTFSDTNGVATFNSTTETGYLRLAYNDEDVWQIVDSNNVAFS